MKINIVIDASWEQEEEAEYLFDSLLDDLWTMGSATGDNIRLVSFNVDGEEFMKAYEGEDYDAKVGRE